MKAIAGAISLSIALLLAFFDPATVSAQKKGGRPGEINTPPAKGERQPDRLKVGDRAPDFTLPTPTGTTKVSLSSFAGKRPVVLIFGSLT